MINLFFKYLISAVYYASYLSLEQNFGISMNGESSWAMAVNNFIEVSQFFGCFFHALFFTAPSGPSNSAFVKVASFQFFKILFLIHHFASESVFHFSSEIF